MQLGFLNCEMNGDEPKSNPNDLPPSYMEAVTGVQLSPRELLKREQLTQVMVDQQWRNLENNTTNQDTDQLIVPEKNRNGYRCVPWIIFIIVLKIIIIVIIHMKLN